MATAWKATEKRTVFGLAVVVEAGEKTGARGRGPSITPATPRCPLGQAARFREKAASPWRYMRMASRRREPRSWARSRGTSSCRGPASQGSPGGRSSSLLLLTRRDEADRGSPAQPSATGRKQCTKCILDFLMVSMRASCRGGGTCRQWAVQAEASPLLTGQQVSPPLARTHEPGNLCPCQVWLAVPRLQHGVRAGMDELSMSVPPSP